MHVESSLHPYEVEWEQIEATMPPLERNEDIVLGVTHDIERSSREERVLPSGRPIIFIESQLVPRPAAETSSQECAPKNKRLFGIINLADLVGRLKIRPSNLQPQEE